MNIRQRHELRLLAERGEFSLERIAERYGVTLRSVRYDIDELNNRLYGIIEADAIVVRSKIARLKEGVPRNLLMALSSTGSDDFNNEALSQRERVLIIVSMLCWSDDFVTIQEFADTFGVSRATATRDFAKVYSYCEEHGLAIERSRGKGARVVASEQDRRRMFTQAIRDCRATDSSHVGFDPADYTTWFPQKDLERIAAIVRDAERLYHVTLDDTAFEAMVVHIALSIKRRRQGTKIDAPINIDAFLEDSDAHFEMANYILKRIEEELDVKLPEEERYYIEIHMGARSGEVASALANGNVGVEFACISLIATVSHRVGVDLTHDMNLYNRLLQHISSSIYRKKVGLMLENPLRDELLGSYAEHAAIIKEAVSSSILGELTETTPDEIAYILLHFETSIVNSRKAEVRLPNIVVVCSTGFGTAELLAAEVSRVFDVNLIANIPAHQVSSITSDMGIDLVISTVPLQIDIPYVEVRPLLKNEDIANIRRALNEFGFIVDAEVPKANATAATSSAPHGLTSPATADSAEGLMGASLGDLLLGNVRLDKEAHSWQEAVRVSGEPLVESGAIDSGYIDLVVANITELGPYVVISQGVALPHAAGAGHVHRTAMSCVRLAEPVAFGAADRDPVRFVFMLATVDATSHMRALVHLAELLTTPEFMQTLAETDNVQQLMDFVTDFETKNADR
ncbi:BglG family transcription antiterminator [Collinsella sp. An2]|uniref:BglG family transcription antiterminator n=1 Tax=Collinsella sp. An2 TaxID=1965585 RepID=UPI000B3ACBFE|nr:BglG family transcription antiterminator [Collinsella sp. An2]OUP09445.1 hypothetical protein B5F33_04560 [Collinsella sp. An2]